jgi:P27 family predicted phage terminase small subunit
MPARRKPTALKILHGDRPDRINDRAPVPPTTDVVRPEWLSPAAVAVWDRLAPDLVRTRVLTAWDVDAFARFCWAAATSVALMAEIDRDGPLVPGARGRELVRHRALSVLRQLDAELLAIGGRFGLTPADRDRIRVVAPDDGRNVERLLSNPTRSQQEGARHNDDHR